MRANLIGKRSRKVGCGAFPERAPHLMGKLWRRLKGAHPAALVAPAGLAGMLLGMTGIALDAVSDGAIATADAAWMLCVAWAWVGVVACVAVLRSSRVVSDGEPAVPVDRRMML